MSGDANNRKGGGSPSSVESLQLNRTKNKEALERKLKSRRTVKELVNQGILYNPSISHPDKVKQLQRARTSDFLKHKIEHRPDRQYLISHHILRDKRGTSPHVLEQCHNLTKYQLKECLTKKLTSRPGSLELVEKGVLQINPRVDSFIKHGSISYPRVESVTVNSSQEEHFEQVKEYLSSSHSNTKAASSSVVTHNNNIVAGNAVTKANTGKSRAGRVSVGRAIRDETVISKLGSLVFHQYCPTSSVTSHNNNNINNNNSFQQKQKAREAQQIQMLRLQDTACADLVIGNESREHNSDKNSLSLDATNQLKQLPVNISPTATNISKMSSSSIDQDSVSNAQYGLGAVITSCYSLAQLTLSQLRLECKERNLVRTGTKTFLMSQLEPYRNELLAKYFPGSIVNNNDEYSSTLRSIQSENGINIPTKNSQLVSSALVSSPVNRPLSICGIIPTEGTITGDGRLHPGLISSKQSVNDSPSLAAQTFTTLRHSISTPFFIDAQNYAITFNLASTQCDRAVNSLIPVTIINTSIVTNVNKFVTSSQTTLATVRTNPEPSFFYLSPSVLTPIESPENGMFVATGTPEAPSATTVTARRRDSFILSNTDEIVTTSIAATACEDMVASTVENPATDQLMEKVQASQSTSLDNFARASDSCSTLDNEIKSIILEDSNYQSATACQLYPSTGSLPTLRQIEETWLRIRQLRKQITETKSSEHYSHNIDRTMNSDNLHRLEQEHDRLSVLCRLLIIERLDALDESGTNSTDFTQLDGINSDIQIERNLMLSYLRRLSGSTLTNHLSMDDNFDFLQSELNCQRGQEPTMPSINNNELNTNDESDAFDPYLPSSDLSDDTDVESHIKLLDTIMTSPADETNEDCAVALTPNCANMLECTAQLSGMGSGGHEQQQHQEQDSEASEICQLDDSTATDVFFEIWNSVIGDDSSPVLTDNENRDFTRFISTVSGARSDAHIALSMDNSDLQFCPQLYAKGSADNSSDNTQINTWSQIPLQQPLFKLQPSFNAVNSKLNDDVTGGERQHYIDLGKYEDQCNLVSTKSETESRSNTKQASQSNWDCKHKSLVKDPSCPPLSHLQTQQHQFLLLPKHSSHTHRDQLNIYSSCTNTMHNCVNNCPVPNSVIELSDALFSNFADRQLDNANLVECMDTTDGFLLTTSSSSHPLSPLSTPAPCISPTLNVNWTIDT